MKALNLNNYIGLIYESKKYGKYTIINAFRENKCNKAVIKFINSEAITTVELIDAVNGKVRDPNYNLNLNKIYYSDNYGPYKIIEIIKGKIGVGTKASIQFLLSKNIATVSVYNALSGSVSDRRSGITTPLDTFVLSAEERDIRLRKFAYSIWYHIIKRCNNEFAENYKFYGGSGVTICDSWKIFENFLNDLPKIPQYEKWYRFPSIYQLDKDYFQLNKPKSERVYSLGTCIFLYFKDNINLKSLEMKLNNKCVSKYFGVSKEGKNSYSTHLIINNHTIYLGTFDDEIVAANVYNYFYEKFHNYEIIPLLNSNIPIIPIEEFIKHNTRPKELCVIRKE